MRNLILAAIFLQVSLPLLLANPFTGQSKFQSSVYHTAEEAIIKSILKNYDREELPLKTSGSPVTMQLNFAFVKLGHVDLNRDQIEVNGWLHLRWKDYRLASNYSHHKQHPLMIQSEHLWIPDLALLNSVGDLGVLQKSDHRVSVKSDGQIDFWTPSRYKVFCSFNSTAITHTCSLKFGSWTYNADMFCLESFPQQTTFLMDYYKPSKHYDIESTTVTKYLKNFDCCDGDYSLLDLTLVFKPKS